jgi:hypothetical protein
VKTSRSTIRNLKFGAISVREGFRLQLMILLNIPVDPRDCGKRFPGHNPEVPCGEHYVSLERFMEVKALERGGPSLRREFFQYLNKTRHDTNEQHPKCTKGAKAHITSKSPHTQRHYSLTVIYCWNDVNF